MTANSNKRTDSVQRNPSNCSAAEVSRGAQMGSLSTQVRCLGLANGRELVGCRERGDGFWIEILGEEVCKGCNMPELFDAYKSIVEVRAGSELFTGFPTFRNTSGAIGGGAHEG